MTTEHEAKRPTAHFLTDTLCEMLAFDGKVYTLSIEQQRAWDVRFTKLCARHGDDRITDLFREYFESGRLKKSTRPGEFAEYAADSTSDRWGHNQAASGRYAEAVARVRQHAENATPWPDEVRWVVMSDCYADLTAAGINPSTPNEQYESAKRSVKVKALYEMNRVWGKPAVDDWAEWRKAITAEVQNRQSWRHMQIGGVV
jgi:hypothetical protein